MLVAYPIAERLEGRNVRAKQRALARDMAVPFARRQAQSWSSVVEMVRFAGAQVPYYRELFSRSRFDPERLARDPRYFQDVPYLTKDIIRAEGERLLRRDHAGFKKHSVRTGGSTGPSAQIFYDQEAVDWSAAVTLHARGTIGHRHASSELHFASRFPEVFPWRDRLRERLKCLAMNRYNVFFSTFEPDELEAVWRQVKSLRPHLVHAHPSTLYHLALHVEASHGRDHAFDIFESSGELLDRRQRQAIARTFGCKIVDRYGLAEIGIVAYQADCNNSALGVFDPFVWPEIAKPDAGVALPHGADAQSGELVVTGLRNRLMPLIRYRTGDMAMLSETPAGFAIRDIVGRVHDVVEIAGLHYPSHYVQDVLGRLGGVKEFQIVVGGASPILRIVPEDGEDLAGLRARIAGWWGTAVVVEFVDVSTLTLQGWRAKFRRVVPMPGDQPAVCEPAPQ